MTWRKKIAAGAALIVTLGGVAVLAGPSSTRNIWGDQIKKTTGETIALPQETTTLCGNTETCTFTNKRIGDSLTFDELGADPSTPAGDQWGLYFKSGGAYIINDGGVASQLLTSASLGNPPIVKKTSAYTLTDDDTVIVANASGGAFTLTLPSAVGRTGKPYSIIKDAADTTTNAVTIAADGSETIGGLPTHVLFLYQQSVSIYSDGANWQIAGTQNYRPFVYASVSSATSDLFLGNETNPSFSTPSESTLTLTNISVPGAIPAEITCSGTNPSSGTTCSAGNEELGISFYWPKPGVAYEVCVRFTFTPGANAASNADAIISFRLAKTANDSQTELEVGPISRSGGTNTSASAANFRDSMETCMISTAADTTTKQTFRLQKQITDYASSANPVITMVLSPAIYTVREM